MLTRHFFFLCVLLFANAPLALGQSSRLFDWSINESLSSLTLSGALYTSDGTILGTLVEQSPGSLSGNISGYGAIPVGVSLDEGKNLVGLATTPFDLSFRRSFKPIADRLFYPGPTYAAYGGVLNAGALGGANVNLTSYFGSIGVQATPLVPQGNGTYTFDSNAVTTSWYGDLNLEGFGLFFDGLEASERIFAPTNVFSNQGGAGSLVVNNGTLTLTIPVQQTHTVGASIFSPFRMDVTTTGQIVATAPAALLDGSFPNGSFEILPAYSFDGANPWHDPTVQSFGAFQPTDGSQMAVIDGYSTDVDFFANSGDLLSFDYFIDANLPDLGEVQIYVDGQLIVNVFGNEAAVETGGWRSVESQITEGGLHNLFIRAERYPDFLGSRLDVGIDNVQLTALGEFKNPALPTSVVVIPGSDIPVFVFEDVPTDQWFDPPTASAFEYLMTSGSLFTSILDFPPGFDQPFIVLVNGIALGQFGPGQAVDFTSFQGGGVSAFTIAGISPLADPEDPQAFPIQLAFNTPRASFTMQAVSVVPEVGSMFMAGAATLAGVGGLVVRRRRFGSQFCA